MVKDVVLTATLIPASEALSKLVEGIVATIHAAKDVLIEKKSFTELSTYLERIIPVVEELIRKSTHNSESMNNVAEILAREIKVAQQLTVECSKRNKLYLLVNCRRIVKRLEDTTKEISRALSLIPLSTLDLSSGINEEINKLRESMLAAEFKATVAEEEIMAKIESGILERNVDRSYANQLLVQIAEAVGISTERAALKKEFEEFKKEIEDAQVRKNRAEAIQMDQIIALLERADAMSSPKEKESKYFSKRISLGSHPLEPLDAFLCPITREVMTDPVETSSSQTFERIAIEKWIAEGNNTCPLTKCPLNPATLRPNKTLRQSIEEWKERNTMITIASMKSKITSSEEEEALHSLNQLRGLCEERDLHREWVVLENYIPLLIELLGSNNRDIRIQALLILCLLVKDSDDTKAKIMEVNNAVESIVKLLARRIGESKLAVALLLELSKCDLVCSHIGNAQGCIFLLVTMLGGNDSQAAKDAQDLLDNLSVHEENVIQMAKANYFKPLLQHLSSGSGDVKMNMAKTLAELKLTDYNKSVLFESGVLQPLLQLISHGDAEMKNVAAKSLESLSSLPENGFQMIKEGAMGPLLDLLCNRGSSATNLRELAATIIMNLALSTTSHRTNHIEVPLLENDDDFFRLFSSINLTTPNIQNCVLLTFHAMCQGPYGTDVKLKIRQTAVPVLVILCEHDNAVRANAVKLFCCLTEDSSDAILAEHVGQTCIETLLRILNTSSDQEEITATMGIISNLPKDNTQMTQWLLDAGALPIIFKSLVDADGLYKNKLIENSVGSLCRFTIPSNKQWQKQAAETGIIPTLVQLLVTSGTALTKQRAAISLAQFSSSSTELSRPIERRVGFWCCSSPHETGCPVHRGICTVNSSFCLVEADAVRPLVRVLREPDLGACEASLDALLTLIDGEKLQGGSKVLGDANAIDAIIRLLSCSSINLQEKVLEALERIFRLIEFKQKYGASAHLPLADITQRGTTAMKSKAARILAQLNVIHEQSSYF